MCAKPCLGRLFSKRARRTLKVVPRRTHRPPLSSSRESPSTTADRSSRRLRRRSCCRERLWARRERLSALRDGADGTARAALASRCASLAAPWAAIVTPRASVGTPRAALGMPSASIVTPREAVARDLAREAAPRAFFAARWTTRKPLRDSALSHRAAHDGTCATLSEEAAAEGSRQPRSFATAGCGPRRTR